MHCICLNSTVITYLIILDILLNTFLLDVHTMLKIKHFGLNVIQVILSSSEPTFQSGLARIDSGLSGC